MLYSIYSAAGIVYAADSRITQRVDPLLYE